MLVNARKKLKAQQSREALGQREWGGAACGVR